MTARKILCISFDRVVSESRSNSLQDAGYDVTASTSIKEGIELLDQERFDAVIIGHRFTTEDKYLLAVEAQEKENTPVVLVCGATQNSEIPASARVYALEGNAGLLVQLSRLCPIESAARSQVA